MSRLDPSGPGRPASSGMVRLLVGVFAVTVLLVTIYVFRHIQGDPLERDRLNPEQRPSVTAPG